MRNILLFVFLSFSVFAIAQTKQIFNKPYLERYEQINSLVDYISNVDSVKAQDTLTTLLAIVSKEGDNVLKQQLSLLKCSVPGFLRNKNEGKKAEWIIDDLLKTKHVNEAIDGYIWLSDAYKAIGKETKALELQLRAFDKYKNYSINRFPNRLRHQRILANTYYGYGEYENAKWYLTQLKNADTTSLVEILRSSHNNLGLTYHRLEQYDSAIICFQQLLEYAKRKNDLGYQAIVMGNIGSVYSDLKQYDSALKWLNLEIVTMKKKPNYLKRPVFYAYSEIASIHYKLDDIVNAKKFLDSAIEMKKLLDYPHIPHLFIYYDYAAKIWHKLGEYRTAYIYLDSAKNELDSLLVKQNTFNLHKAEKKLNETKHLLELNKIEYAQKKSVWLRNIVILIILFIGIVVLLVINRNVLKLEQRQLILENQKNAAETKLLKFTNEIHAKNHKLNLLEKEVSLLSNEQEVNNKHQLVEEMRQSTILTDIEWSNFRELFEQVHSGYIERIKENYPGITPAETRYVTLLKLNMTNIEMANVLGVGDGTIRNLKSRMRKKFDIASDVNFEDLIRSI